MYRQSKLKALVMNIVMQRIRTVEAADVSDMLCTCKMQWYIMGMLTIITLSMLYLATNKLRKSSLFKGCLFSNNTKILLFISNTHSYIPIKLCRVAGSIHLFRIRRLNSDNVKLKKNWIWDVLEIDWSDISITLNDNEIDLPSSVIIPFKERYRARRLLENIHYYFMLCLNRARHGLAWSWNLEISALLTTIIKTLGMSLLNIIMFYILEKMARSLNSRCDLEMGSFHVTFQKMLYFWC